METKKITLEDQLNGLVVGSGATVSLGTPIGSLQGKFTHIALRSNQFAKPYRTPALIAVGLASVWWFSHFHLPELVGHNLVQTESQTTGTSSKAITPTIEAQLSQSFDKNNLEYVSKSKVEDSGNAAPKVAPVPLQVLTRQEITSPVVAKRPMSDTKQGIEKPTTSMPKQVANSIQDSVRMRDEHEAGEEDLGFIDFSVAPDGAPDKPFQAVNQVDAQMPPSSKLLSPNKEVLDGSSLGTMVSQTNKQVANKEKGEEKPRQQAKTAVAAKHSSAGNKTATAKPYSVQTDDEFVNAPGLAKPISQRNISGKEVGQAPVRVEQVAAAKTPNIEVVEIDPDGGYVLITNPETQLPNRFLVGEKLPNGMTLNKIDGAKGLIKAGKYTYLAE